MSEYLILIDKESVKLNAERGKSSSKVFGAKTIEFSCQTMPDILKDGENCFVMNWHHCGDMIFDIDGHLENEDLIEELLTNPKYADNRITIKVDNNITTIDHFPIPKYNFEYTPLKVKCNECGHEFMSNEFKSLEFSDYDEDGNENSFGYRYTETGCPKCGAFDCCDVKYQRIEDIEHELNTN